MKGTWPGILQELEDWLHHEQAERILWLGGRAGTGKSATVAQTFADIFFADGILSASFFCSQWSGDRDNVQLILPTLAFQLAHWYPRFRQELLKLLKRNPEVGRESLDSQMEILIAGPSESGQQENIQRTLIYH